MSITFVNIPRTGGEVFEKNFHGRRYKMGNTFGGIVSVGHSWSYPTQIKGWLDWDFPNQPMGVFRDVNVFVPNTRIATIIRNPFSLLVDYFYNDWAWCKKFHNLENKEPSISDFQEFVDIYLDDSIPFHAPAFKKSLFSQLKDSDGKWIIDENSIVLRFEQLHSDFKIFSEMTNIEVETFMGIDDYKIINSIDDYYRPDQISNLKKLWKDDLDYLGYLNDKSVKSTTSESLYKNKLQKKLKVALCFSGNIRDIEHTKDFWLNLIDEYDIDVYASFWSDENVKNNDTINNFKRIYSVKELEIEDYLSFKKSTLDVLTPMIDAPNALFSNLVEYANELHTLSMWYKIWKCNMLTKKLNIDYDVVIRARTDSYLNPDIQIEKNNYLNVPVGRVYADYWKNSEGVNDIFGYGSSKIMDYYASTFLSLMHYVHQGHYMIPPEHLLRVHLHHANLSIRFFPTKLILTRKSKGRDDEFYNRNASMEEEILPSDFMDITPNKELSWTRPIKESLKF